MIPNPIQQRNHNYIGAEIMPWLNLHFPADVKYKGRIHIGYRRKDSNGIYDLSCRSIDELAGFIPLMHISRRLDYYITANTVSGVERRTDQVFSLHNIVIDVDCHEDAANAMELAANFVWRCSRDLWSTGVMPEPNSIVYTGRGVQLWWSIESASAKLQYWYRRMTSWLMDGLQDLLDEYSIDEKKSGKKKTDEKGVLGELGALSIDRASSVKLAGLFRLPLTYNTKTGIKGSVQILHSRRYRLTEMLEQYVPHTYNPNLRKNTPQSSVGAVSEGNEPHVYVPLAPRDAEVMRGITTAMGARVAKLCRLRAMRQASNGDEMRDRFCFAVYCALLADHTKSEAWDKLLAFNSDFSSPLPPQKLRQMMSTATEKHGYRLSNAWLIDVLEISEDEQSAIDLFSGSEHRKRREQNYTRDLVRQIVREDRDNKILMLHAEGVSKAEIARKLNLAWNTVAKVICAAEAQEAVTEEVLEQIAAGAEDLQQTQNAKRATSSKTVLNNIVSYGTSPSSMSSGGGQGLLNRPATVRNIDGPS